MNNVRSFCIAIAMFCATALEAQQVPRKVVAEHFTNTYCSICASRNPGFYANLFSFPEVLHIAYHPSAPYAACPLSMHNVAENDARTNYYGVYGATPRLVIEGTVLAAAANYSSASIFTPELGQTSSFTVGVALTAAAPDSVLTTVVVRKVDTSSITSLTLYALIAEDTLFFPANNGEAVHHDVFRKAVWGAMPLAITAPAMVGDSVVYAQKTALNSVWHNNQLSATALLQDAGKRVVQAGRSAHLPYAAAVTELQSPAAISVFPNPAQQTLFINGSNIEYPYTATITNAIGSLVLSAMVYDGKMPLPISAIAPGAYFLSVSNGRQLLKTRFVKVP